MIKLIKTDGINTRVIKVTHGAYENIYRRQGYVPLAEEVSVDRSQKTVDEDAVFMETVETKPIAQWSTNELKQYAKLVGINPRSKNLRELIMQMIERKEEADDGQRENQDGTA